MDIIFLKDLKIETVVGIYDWERKIKQTVILDLEMATDVKKQRQVIKLRTLLTIKQLRNV